MANATFEEVLDKLSFTSVNSKDFLEILFETDEKGVDYLSSLKKEFKEKYVLPTFNKAKKIYTDIGKSLKTVEDNKEIIQAFEDPLNITKLNKEYKEKAKEIFEKKLKQIGDTKLFDLKLDEIETSNKATASSFIKESLEDLTTKLTPKLKNDQIAQKQIIQTVTPDLASKIENQNLQQKQLVSNINPELISKIKSNENKELEQATFTEKPKIFSLSEDTLIKLKEIFNLIKPNVNVKVEKEKEGFDWMKLIGGLLAAGGAIALLANAFWDKIKPWIEKKFNFNLDFLEKFEGAAETITKFFTLGGLKITAGPLFTLVGKAFTTFGELIEGALKSIFKLGFGDEVVEAGTKAAPAAWKTLLPKIAGGLFKGPGKILLKGIPILGSLISFYFAYDRFQQGDNIQGIVELIAGVAGLIPGVGIPLSIGLSALNAFIDYKVGDLPKDQQQTAAAGIIGSLGKKVYDMVKDIPIIGGLFNFGLGIYELASGNFTKGLDYLSQQPFLGPIPGILKSLIDATVENPDGSKSFSFEKFKTEIKKNMFKFMLSLLPPAGLDFGLRGMIANTMGLEYNSKTGEVTEAPLDVESINKTERERREKLAEKYKSMDPAKLATDPTALKEAESVLQQTSANIEESKAKVEEAKRTLPIVSTLKKMAFTGVGGLVSGVVEYFANVNQKEQELQDTMQEHITVGNKVLEAKKAQKDSPIIETEKVEGKDAIVVTKDPQRVQDFYKPADGQPSLLMTRNQTFQTDPSDDIVAFKSDGVFDKGFKQLSGIMESINRGIYKMSSDMKNISPQQGAPSLSIASNASKKNMNDIVLSGGRDTIYELRTLWWRKSINFREFA